MKFCYCDESGVGGEPISVLVGIVVDAARMHLTKTEWLELLQVLSGLCKRTISELRASDFYRGNGPWRSVDGRTRSRIITEIFQWLSDRKHSVVYSALTKARYDEAKASGVLPDELRTPWRVLGFHLVLSIQRAHQALQRNKGNTVFVFDQRAHDELAFTDLVARPPAWSDAYYARPTKASALDQVIDVPYFADSREVGLLQLADVSAYFLRRYLEIREGLSTAKYEDEEEKVTQWVEALASRSIGRPHMYLSKGRPAAADLFYQLAPEAVLAI